MLFLRDKVILIIRMIALWLLGNSHGDYNAQTSQLGLCGIYVLAESDSFRHKENQN